MLKAMLSSSRNRLSQAVLVLLGKSFVYPRDTYCCHQLSFSQEGEDGILQRIFEKKNAGFYVDVGAHHPQRFSNTYKFYLCGWQGINIDPLPGSKARFDVLRQRDINLELGISDSSGEAIYYAFSEPAFNTFDSTSASLHLPNLVSKHKVKICRLSDVLDRYLEVNQHIDFLSVDVEGYDLKVLKSNDWYRYRPSYVLAEVLGMSDIYQVLESDLCKYMASLGYSLFAKSVNTLFFKDAYPHV